MKVDSINAKYCFLDIDINNHRHKLAVAAAFVNATNTRYGFSSKDLLHLGGSEVSRIQSELIQTDHEWSSKDKEVGGVEIKPPKNGTRIIVKLYWDIAPLACENFATLCHNGSTVMPPGSTSSGGKSNNKPTPPPIGECGKPLTYRNSIIHRVIPNFIVQGGDFVFGNGSGGEPVVNNGKKFKDEKGGLALKHTSKRGILSMGNSGKNSNTSQFFFTLYDPNEQDNNNNNNNVEGKKLLSQCDGKHVIFGELLSGWNILKEIETYGSKSGEPSTSITITDCGIYHPLHVPGNGYWYDQPDSESYTGISPTFICRPRVVIVVPNASVGTKFQSSLGSFVDIIEVLTLTIMEDNTDDQEKVTTTAQRVLELLETFAIDVIVVAPACRDIILSTVTSLPQSWVDALSSSDDDVSTTKITIDQVILESKPINALQHIQQNSWLSKQYRPSWRLDGV